MALGEHVQGLSVCLRNINNDVPSVSELSQSYLFYAARSHAGLIDARWAASELHATPVEPTEMGFLLAPMRCSVRGTKAQLKHTPSSRW